MVPQNVAAVTMNAVSAALKSDAVFSDIEKQINSDPATAKAINAVFTYNITVNGKVTKKWSKCLYSQKLIL